MISNNHPESIQTANKHRRYLQRPVLMLILAMMATFVLAWILGQLSLLKGPDSTGYIYFSTVSWHKTLTSVITLGYPGFLRVLSLFNPSFSWLPAIQLLIHCLAVFCFFRAIIDFGAPATASCWASIALAVSALNDGFFSMLGTDSIGQSLALVTIAGCFWAAARTKAWWPLLLIALTAMAAYQVRPVYLILFGFVPCLTLMLLILHPQSEKRWGFLLRRPAILTAFLLVPFLLFCTFRWAAVGHFGLISFTGWNQISITSEMLTVGSIRHKLPGRWTEISSLILKSRERQGVVSAFQEDRIDYQQWRDNYEKNQQIVIRSATQLFGENPILVNRLLSQFSKDLIKASPKPYIIFVAKNIFRGVFLEVFNGQYVLIIGLTVLILLFYGRQLISCWEGRRGRMSSVTYTGDPLPAYVRDGVALGAGLLLIMKVFVVCLLENPIRRYIHPAGMLLPAFIGLLIFREAKLFADKALSRGSDIS